MDSDLTGKYPVNVKITPMVNVTDNSKIYVKGFMLQAVAEKKLVVTYNGLEYELFDIDGHLMLNRVYR